MVNINCCYYEISFHKINMIKLNNMFSNWNFYYILIIISSIFMIYMIIITIINVKKNVEINLYNDISFDEQLKDLTLNIL